MQKIRFFLDRYNRQVARLSQDETTVDTLDYSIKWSSTLIRRLKQLEKIYFDTQLIVKVLRRPFVRFFYYSEKSLSDRLTANHYEMFGRDLSQDNIAVGVNVGNKPFNVLASKYLVDLHFNGDSQCFPRYRYDVHGGRQDNITPWAVAQFEARYGEELEIGTAGLHAPLDIDADATVRDAIFYYVYGVLHNPAYREKYALNLKREFPRIPFYADFAQWAAWGQALMDLHLNFEAVEPYPLQRVDLPRDPDAPPKQPKPKLKSDEEAQTIILDSETTLAKVPPEAWQYVLGNRAAIDWVLYYYKERKPRDPTIREQFNTYRFADYKEEVIDLLGRVVTVSVETVKIVERMRAVEITEETDAA
jgi:predicted helicase